ncbi:MAG: hypothetical protein HGA45_08020 [Chloroflexales bacterium]|nr:hypothetical protein [Chloroflexales bacterium]
MSHSGIAEAVRSQLFEPFHQADGSSTRRYGGIGLSLALSRCIFERMGGAIGVEPMDGPGATFWFQVPLRKVAALTAPSS